MVVIYTSKELG